MCVHEEQSAFHPHLTIHWWKNPLIRVDPLNLNSPLWMVPSSMKRIQQKENMILILLQRERERERERERNREREITLSCTNCISSLSKINGKVLVCITVQKFQYRKYVLYSGSYHYFNWLIKCDSWQIDCLLFNDVSALFQSCNGGDYFGKWSVLKLWTFTGGHHETNGLLPAECKLSLTSIVYRDSSGGHCHVKK